MAKVLLGEAPPELEPLTASPEATETVWQVAVEQSKYWQNLHPQALEPREGYTFLFSRLTPINAYNRRS